MNNQLINLGKGVLGRKLASNLGVKSQMLIPRPKIERELVLNRERSILGTDVEGAVILRAEEYEDYRGDTVVPPQPIIFRAAICRAAINKNIVRTSIQGRPGEVKEYVSTGDYDVVIRATITNNENVFANGPVGSGYGSWENENKIPVEQISFISRWIETDTVVQIENEYLNSLGITDIIILGADMPQKRATPGTVEFEIYAVQERFQDLVIINPNDNVEL